MEHPLALVVEPDPVQRTLICSAFERRGVTARAATSGAEATIVLREGPVQYLVIDTAAPEVGADRVLEQLPGLRPAPVVITVAETDGEETTAARVERWELGRLRRPLDDARCELAVGHAVRYRAALDESDRLREELQRREGYRGLVGRSTAMARLRERIEALARESRSVWFHGEGGSGKELAARTLHARSGRAASRFALCSCAGLDASNWSERLGLDETDDPRDDGFLARAAGGSLYLEDVPRLARDLQSRLRDLLERPAVRTLDLRVLGSSGTDPDTLVEQGRVVESLRAHLGHETVSLPPLRERTEDIPLLARHFVRTIAAINELPPIRVAPGALHLLERYRWPENVQELRDALERAVILSTDGTIRPDDLPPRVREAVSSAAAMPASEELPLRPFRDAKRDIVESFERGYLQTLMERHRGNVTAASRRAGMLRSALQRLLRKHGLKSETFRRQGVAQKGGESTRPVP